MIKTEMTAAEDINSELKNNKSTSKNIHVNTNNNDVTNDNVVINDNVTSKYRDVTYTSSVNSDPDFELVERRHFQHEMKCETTFVGMYSRFSICSRDNLSLVMIRC